MTTKKTNPFDTTSESSDPFSLKAKEIVREVAKNLDINPMSLTAPEGYKPILVKKEFNIEALNKIKELEDELQKITAINTQDDAQKANASLKKAKTIIKTLSAERLQMTSVLDDAKAEIMQYEKYVVEKLSDQVTAINNAITQFQIREDKRLKEAAEKIEREKQEEIAKQNADIARKKNIQEMIISFEKNVNNAIESATIENIQEKIKQLAGFKFDPETYQEFMSEAKIMYEQSVVKLNNRHVELQEIFAAKNTPEALELKKQAEERIAKEKEEQAQKELELAAKIQEESQASASNIQMTSELKQSIQVKQKGISKTWTFEEETIDINLLPLEFHTYDKAKIKEAIAAGRKEIPGVNIFEKIINVSR